MALRNLKKVLLSLIVVGALGSLTLHKVYASFNTEAFNAGSTISNGTLTLTQVVTQGIGGTPVAGSPCKSYTAAANTSSVCDQLFTDASVWFPGQVKTVGVSLTNSGSLDARTLEVWMPSCTKQNTTINGATVAGEVNGGGDPCAAGGAEFYIQETKSDYSTAVQCWYPNTNTTCGAFGTIANFMTTYTSAAPGLRLFDPTNPNMLKILPKYGTNDGATPTPNNLYVRYFVIGMELPPTASNTLQGQAATFPLTWHMDS